MKPIFAALSVLLLPALLCASLCVAPTVSFAAGEVPTAPAAESGPMPAAGLVSLPTRPGVTQSLYLEPPPATPGAPAPAWIAVLFAGDDGALALAADGPGRMKGNFVIRTRSYWPAAGMVAAAFDAPSDSASGMGDGFRLSDAHAQDVALAVAWLRLKYPSSRIALVGTSRGTISVGNVLRQNPHLADAYVLTSPVTIAGRGGPGLSGVSWTPSGARVLVLANRNDGCAVSPFWSAQKVAQANGFDFIAVASDAGETRMPGACGAHSPHGYLGIESSVLDAITGWLRGAAVPAQ